MSFYTDHVSLAPLPDGNWRLERGLIWEIGEKGSGYIYTIPAGFVSDLASIPRLARIFIDRGDARLAKASILHDHMIQNTGFSPITASAEFAAALLADGVGKWRAILMGLAVLAWKA